MRLARLFTHNHPHVKRELRQSTSNASFFSKFFSYSGQALQSKRSMTWKRPHFLATEGCAMLSKTTLFLAIATIFSFAIAHPALQSPAFSAEKPSTIAWGNDLNQVNLIIWPFLEKSGLLSDDHYQAFFSEFITENKRTSDTWAPVVKDKLGHFHECNDKGQLTKHLTRELKHMDALDRSLNLMMIFKGNCHLLKIIKCLVQCIILNNHFKFDQLEKIR